MDLWEAALGRQMEAVVLVTGDSDFGVLVDGLTNRGIEVWVVGPDCSTSPNLILAASHFLKASEVPGFIRLAATRARSEPAQPIGPAWVPAMKALPA
jgi:uncharacterized LabA/DUF88 family protein